MLFSIIINCFLNSLAFKNNPVLFGMVLERSIDRHEVKNRGKQCENSQRNQKVFCHRFHFRSR